MPGHDAARSGHDAPNPAPLWRVDREGQDGDAGSTDPPTPEDDLRRVADAEPLDTVALAIGMLMERHLEDVDSASARLMTLAGDAGLEIVQAAVSLVDSYSVQIGAAARTPAVVSRAMEFMEANAGHDVGIDEIAQTARIGVRGLQAAFRRYRGQTPLECLRGIRMRHAHQDLMAANPAAGDTVADIAARWRFAHPGRFSVEYRRSYHCSPSATLRR